MMKPPLRFASVVTVSLALAGCAKKDPPPEKPVTGAPVAFEVLAMKKDALDVRVYNFSDKTLARHDLAIQYKDASGKPLDAPLGRDHVHWGIQGLSFEAKPGVWTKMTLDHLQIPPTATQAEVLVTGATALASDGIHYEQTPVWDMGYVASWPGKK